jgi:uncharacterized protein (TIGR03435 family)
VYALVAGNGGAKLTPAEKAGRAPGSAWTDAGVSRLNVTGTLGTFADLLTKVSDRPVVDATGIAGAFAFDVAYTAQLVESEATPSLTTALRAMGLRLEKRDTPLAILAIDRAEKIPSEN